MGVDNNRKTQMNYAIAVIKVFAGVLFLLIAVCFIRVGFPEMGGLKALCAVMALYAVTTCVALQGAKIEP